MKLIIQIFVVFSLITPVHAQNDLFQAIEQDYTYLDKLYKHLHKHPEISNQEKKTAKRIADELKSVGFKVTENVGGFGVVGVIENGEGPTVLIRTDLDGLPLEEKTGVDYASKVQVVDSLGKTVHTMHACGHDVHMTVFTGTARRLAASRDQWQGTLVMIGQPAEEKGTGAKAMLEDGLYQRFPKPDYVLGLHTDASLPAGQIAQIEGYAMASVNSVDIRVFGVGSHGAYPHKGKDPIVVAAQIVTALQTLVSRELPAVEAGVVTVGSIHGGTTHNIISDQVDLQLTVRSYTEETRQTLLNGIKRIAHAQGLSAGLPNDKLPLVTVRKASTPALYNDPALTQRISRLLSGHLGEKQVVAGSQAMVGEDFGRYSLFEPRIPSVFLRLGTVDPETYASKKDELPSLHSPYFKPLPRPTILTGVKAMTLSALDLLAKPDSR